MYSNTVAQQLSKVFTLLPEIPAKFIRIVNDLTELENLKDADREKLLDDLMTDFGRLCRLRTD